MNLALWIVAGLLAVVFLVSGSTKLFVPKKNLDGLLQRVGPAAQTAGEWTRDFSPRALKTIGVLELLGAVGLILPAALDIAPVLVPLAATGLATIMVGAAIVTYRRQEFKHVLLNLTYLALIAFVAWGRFGPGSFTG
jgi:uncharacterized membrane protein YphA (DoxX/SURF4 family)